MVMSRREIAWLACGLLASGWLSVLFGTLAASERDQDRARARHIACIGERVAASAIVGLIPPAVCP